MSVSASRRPAIQTLTSLRFFAALWVVLFHVHEIGLNTGGSAAYLDFALLGYLGVSFFFVLSGFILVYVYAGRSITKGQFWQARFARIYPVYLFSLLVSLGTLMHFWPLTQQRHLGALVLIGHPLLIEAWFPQLLLTWNPVAWTLSAEAFFYLLFPFILPTLEKLEWPQLRLCLGSFWLITLIFTGAYVLLHPDGVLHTTAADNNLFWLGVVKLNPIVRLPEFLLGMGAGSAFLRFRDRARTWPIILGALLMLMAIAFQRYIPFPILHSGLLAPAFALLIFGFASEPAWTRPLGVKPLVLLGEASYSLYLLHGFFIVTGLVMFGRSPHRALVTVGMILVAILAAIIVYFLLERPVRRLLHPRYTTPMVTNSISDSATS